jgi:hypothetical protein
VNLHPTRNPFAQSPGCATCDDTRHVSARDYSAVKCPVCGCTCPKRGKDEPPPSPCPGCITSADLKREAFRRHGKPTTIIELDLTPLEFAVYRQLRALHPNASKLTALGWMDAQRYVPAKDPVFLAECEAALDDWRHATGRETKREAA